MTVIYLWEIFVNLIENTVVAFLLFHRLTFRNSRYSTGTFVGFVILSCSLISCCNMYQINTTTTQLAIFLFRMIFISICFRNTFSQKIFTCCFPSFASIFANQITYTIALVVSAKNLTSSAFLGNNRIISNLLYLFFTFVFMIVFLRFFDNIFSPPKKRYIFLATTTVIALFVTTFFLNIIVEADTDALPMKYRIQLNSISVFILLVYLAILFLIQIISKAFQENTKLTEQIYIHEKNEERNKAVFQSTRNLRKWKHDYSNHLAVIHELIETKSYDRLYQYVSQQREYLPKTFPSINTGHHIIDAILTDKYAIAQSEHISFVYSVVLPKQFPVSDIEITGILGNLLNNSIEACKDIGRKRDDASPYINVILKPQRSTFHIHVENSSAGNYRYNLNGKLESTKKEPGQHGNGISNVMEIAESHSGFCNITAEPDHFSVDVYIPLLIER